MNSKKNVIPADVEVALEENSVAKRVYTDLALSRKREYLDWIESAKKELTRKRHIEKMIDMLLEKSI